jgi:molybdopterin-binding protein
VGFMHDVVRSACKNGLIFSMFSIPAILILQLRSCDNCSTWQIGLEAKYGTAPDLTPGPVVAVVAAPVEELFAVVAVVAVVAEDKLSVTTGAEAFSALKNTPECFT